MRTLRFFFTTLLAMTVLAGASAFAQQGARRNTTVTTRQETKAEKKQTKVNEVQKPTNVVNQPVTDAKMRQAGGTQSDRRNGTGSTASNGSKTGSTSSGGTSASNGGYGAGNGGVGTGNAGKGTGTGNGSTGGYGAGNGNTGTGTGPGSGGVGNGNAGKGTGTGNGNGSTGARPDGNGPGMGGGRPQTGTYPGGYDYPGTRPPMPNTRTYDKAQVVTRTNASSVVVRTVFRTKAEAYDYVARLLDERFFTIASYGNGYSWMQTEVAFVPTPFDWTNPMTHNQFRIKVKITRSFGVVRVTLTGEWRESILSSVFSVLRFQPSESYSTYYAWNILEDIAEEIPGTSISYR